MEYCQEEEIEVITQCLLNKHGPITSEDHANIKLNLNTRLLTPKKQFLLLKHKPATYQTRI